MGVGACVSDGGGEGCSGVGGASNGVAVGTSLGAGVGPCVGVGAGGGGSGSLGLRLIVRPGASAVPFPAHAQATTDVAQE
jgi:hypothetical protein